MLYETKLYKILQSGTGIPHVHHFETEGGYNCLVMDLLGPSLEDMYNYCKRKFSLKTVLMIADQMIQRVEFMHSRSFLHRDIKPDNFLIGLGKTSHLVHAIDFGLAKRYRNTKDGSHISFKDGKNLTGTARYASLNTHLGYEQSRRDDMEGIGFVLMYFLKKALPWQGLTAKNKKEKYERIKEVKRDTPVEELCEGCPREFVKYFNYIRSLKFEEIPDYSYCRGLFKGLMKEKAWPMDF